MHPTVRVAAAVVLWFQFIQAGSAQVPEAWRVDHGLYPKAYGILADEHLMHPADVSNWPLAIDAQRQLFLDDELIASLDGLRRQINPARKHPQNPLIIPDRPWEADGCLFPFVLRDGATGKFRMWYSAAANYVQPTGETSRWLGCYAESDDGIRWVKPNLGLHEWNGSRENNIVITDGGLFGLMLTPEDRDPNRRFKTLVLRHQNQPGEGYFLYASADGIHWIREREERVIPSLQGYALPQSGIGDTSQFRWDPRLKEYIGDVKFVLPGKIRVRAIMESDDLIHWTRPRMTLYPDALDDPKAQIYGHAGFVYESLWLGLVRVMHDDFVSGSYKQTTVELTCSRDGRHWYRVGGRKQFIPLGQPTEWDPHYHDPTSAPVLVGDELWFYYRSTPLWSDMHDKVSRIGLATLRRDGFVSLDAGDSPGTVVTRPLTFAGQALFVNAEIAKGGHLKAELRDSAGQPAAPCTLGQCTPLTDSQLAGQIVWGQRRTIDHQASQPLRLVFELKNAKLYSFWIE